MTYALGCHPPDLAKLALKQDARAHPGIRDRLQAAPLPPSADKLTPWTRVDQGPTGNCTWASSAIALYLAFKSLGVDIDIPSQREGYAGTRALGRGASLPGFVQAPPLQDWGTNLEAVWEFMERYGVEPMIMPNTPDGRFSDVTAENVNDEVDFPRLLSGKGVALTATDYAISPQDPQRSDLMAAALDAGNGTPIEACGLVDQDFMNLQPGQLAPVPKPNNGGGGHAFAFSAYRTSTQGKREFRLENSWGYRWCERGACWVPEEFCAVLWAIYPLHPKLVTLT